MSDAEDSTNIDTSQTPCDRNQTPHDEFIFPFENDYMTLFDPKIENTDPRVDYEEGVVEVEFKTDTKHVVYTFNARHEAIVNEQLESIDDRMTYVVFEKLCLKKNVMKTTTTSNDADQ